MKERSRHTLIRSVILLIALVFMGVSVTFAWFMHSLQSDVDRFVGGVVRANNCQVSGNGIDWGYELEITPGPTVFSPLTGNGRELYKPVYTPITTTDKTVIAGNETDVAYTQMTMTGLQYLSGDSEELKQYALVQDMYIKTSGGVYLTLSPNSYVLPAERSNVGAGSTIDRNDVAGAIRVAMLKKVGNSYKLLFIWAPNSTYELVTPEGKTFPTQVDHDGAVETDYQLYIDGGFAAIPTGGQASGYQEVAGAYYIWGDLAQIPDLDQLMLDDDMGTETDSIGQYRLLIWLEGTDRECHEVLAEGQVTTKLEFKTEFINE